LDTLRLALPVAEGTIGTMEISGDRMRAALSWDLLATDLAEYLVARGLPFRDAHRVAGEVFAHCARDSIEPPDLDLGTLRGFSPAFDEDVKAVWDYRASVARRSVRGGPGDIRSQLEAAKRTL